MLIFFCSLFWCYWGLRAQMQGWHPTIAVNHDPHQDRWFGSVGVNQSVWRNPTQAAGDHANSIQGCWAGAACNPTGNLLARGEMCNVADHIYKHWFNWFIKAGMSQNKPLCPALNKDISLVRLKRLKEEYWPIFIPKYPFYLSFQTIKEYRYLKKKQGANMYLCAAADF